VNNHFAFRVSNRIVITRLPQWWRRKKAIFVSVFYNPQPKALKLMPTENFL